jgi:hypothetical protein
LAQDGAKYGDWRDGFFKNGYTIIKGVITLEKAEYYRQAHFKWLKSFGLGFDKNDESTSYNDHLPAAFKGGMYLVYSAAHEKFMWEGRLYAHLLPPCFLGLITDTSYGTGYPEDIR